MLELSGNTLSAAMGILLCLTFTACGDGSIEPASRPSPGSRRSSRTAATILAHKDVPDSYQTGDGDVDDENGKDPPKSNDDYPLTEYGHVAGAADGQRIALLLKRYYAAAAADEGVVACSLLDSRIAADPGLTKTIPEDRYSRLVYPNALPGESCAHVATLLFKRYRQNLAGEAATLRVRQVRTDGVHGLAILCFKKVPEEWIPVVRQGTVWKLAALLAAGLP